MNIQQTISKELAEDVQNLLSDYIMKSKSKHKFQVTKVISELVTKGELSPETKDNLKRASSYALGVAGGIALGGGIIDAGLDILAYNQVTNTGAFAATMGIGLSFMVSGLYLNSQAEKPSTDPSVPEAVRNLLARDDFYEIHNNFKKMTAVLSELPQKDFDQIEQLAWISANRNDIQAQKKPIEPQYSRPSRPSM